MTPVSLENYLPLSYNKTNLVLLAINPHYLYAFWEINQKDKQNIINDLGKELWKMSYPVLKIINITKNKSFFIKIDEYTTSRYVSVEVANSLYSAELGRIIKDSCFLNIADSNCIRTPNNMLSSSNNICFVNSLDLRHGKLNINMNYSNPEFIYEDFTNTNSSPVFFERKYGNTYTNLSSDVFYGTDYS